jgi:hypothetical protein
MPGGGHLAGNFLGPALLTGSRVWPTTEREDQPEVAFYWSARGMAPTTA